MRRSVKSAAALISAVIVFSAASSPVSGAYALEPDISGTAELISQDYSSAVTASADAGDCALLIRENLEARKTPFTVDIPLSLVRSKDDIDDIFRTAVAETGVPVQGDYIRFSVSGLSYSAKPDVSRGVYSVTFSMNYNSTAAQEKKVDEAVKSVLSALSMDKLSDYDKLRNVYGYIAKNVSYSKNFDDVSVYSAYGAAVEHDAVCQGYSLLMYRMLTELGVTCRIIPGIGNGGGHAWNIAKIGDKYYYLDSTWDSPPAKNGYSFFLRGRLDFDSLTYGNSHAIDWDSQDFTVLRDCYDNSVFWDTYPLSDYAFPAPAVEYSLGDTDGGGVIDSADASTILKAYANLATLGVTGMSLSCEKAADVNQDGSIDSSDASTVLAYYGQRATGNNISFDKFINK